MTFGRIHRRQRSLPEFFMLLGTAVLSALGTLELLSACTTDTPPENFTIPKVGGNSGGSGPSIGGSSGASSSGGSTGTSSGGAASGGAGAAGGTSSGGGGVSFSPYDCGAPPISEGEFSMAALRAAAADCAIWHYSCFEGAASVLSEHIGAYYEQQTAENLELSRAAWIDAMARWSKVELFQFGPLASPIKAAGKDVYEGQGIRELIYSWPSVARCSVEQEIINQDYTRAGDVFISERGLFGLEYVLFHPDPDTACTATSKEAQTWAMMSPQELWLRKVDYALWAAADVHEKAQQLGHFWSPAGDNFRQTFVAAGGKYPSEHAVLNVMAWALIYVEHEVKDWKIGIPAGITLPEMTPVSGPESPFAGVATQNLRANLRGFRSLFQGCGENGEGIGFDDWLTSTGFGDLASRMLSAWQGAQDALDALPPLHQASPEQLQSAHAAIKRLTDPLKTEFLSAGMLSLPEGVASDTD